MERNTWMAFTEGLARRLGGEVISRTTDIENYEWTMQLPFLERNFMSICSRAYFEDTDLSDALVKDVIDGTLLFERKSKIVRVEGGEEAGNLKISVLNNRREMALEIGSIFNGRLWGYQYYASLYQ